MKFRNAFHAFTVAVPILLASTNVARADEKPPQSDEERQAVEKDMCEHTVCQRDLRIVLKQKDGTTYDKTFKVFPGVIQDAGVTVVAGQTVYVEAEIEGERLKYLRAVEAITHPETTITLKLEQNEDGMILNIKNPFPRTLKFDMGIMPLDKDGLYKTSSCPVHAGIESFEMWPYPIFQVFLGNGRVLDEKASMDCVE